MGKFVIYRSAAGCRFDLKAGNGETIAASETYDTESACRKGIESVRKCAAARKIEDLTESAAKVTNPKFQLFCDKAGAFRFRLKARNGQIIAASEAYTAHGACLTGIESVIANAPDAEITEE